MVIRHLGFSAALVSLLALACRPGFETVRGHDLRARWEASLADSAVSWWYAGEDSEYQYLVEKRPLDVRGYKVPKDEVSIAVPLGKTLSFDEAAWVNLKVGDISFKDSS